MAVSDQKPSMTSFADVRCVFTTKKEALEPSVKRRTTRFLVYPSSVIEKTWRRGVTHRHRIGIVIERRPTLAGLTKIRKKRSFGMVSAQE